MTSELDFIRQLQKRCRVRPPVEVGIGDDGAILKGSDNTSQVVVTDLLLDGVHFDLSSTTPRLAGRKALAVNLSDLAAMACWPTAAFTSIVVPRNLESKQAFLDELYSGMQEFTDRYEFCVAGGDTNSWDGPFAINVTLTGAPIADSPVLRSTARPGDFIVVTGPLGGSLPNHRHLHFEPRLNVARQLCNHLKVHALMDISDGLSIDLTRMMEASGTGAVINAADVPIHQDVPSSISADERLEHAMNDGEDFELLATVASVPDMPLTDLRLHVIGRVTDDAGTIHLTQPNGVPDLLQVKGWQHLNENE